MLHEERQPERRTRTVKEDVGEGRLDTHDLSDHGLTSLTETGLEAYSQTEDHFTIFEDEPLSASVTCTGKAGLKREDWDIRVETYSHMTSDADHFHVTHVLDAYEGNVRVFSKTWHVKIPRHLV